jgi:hypothetical protein
MSAEVDRGDRRVGAVPLGLRREGEDDQPAEEPAQGRDEGQGPEAPDREEAGRTLAGRIRREIPHPQAEEEHRRHVDRVREDDRAQAGDGADQDGDPDPLADVARRLHGATDRLGAIVHGGFLVRPHRLAPPFLPDLGL